jgi:thioredoxin-like negative regulator of GroEL
MGLSRSGGPAGLAAVATAVVVALGAAMAGGDLRPGDPRVDLRLAREKGRPLMISFETSWCQTCRRMAKTTWKDEGVMAALQGFTAFAVDGERERGLASRYRVKTYPTVVFATPDGDPVFIVHGYQRARTMYEHVLAVWKDRERLGGLAARARGKKGEPEAKIELAAFAAEREAFQHAEGLLRSCLEREKKLPGEIAARARVGLAEVLIATDRCKEAGEILAGVPTPVPELVARRHRSVSKRIDDCES